MTDAERVMEGLEEALAYVEGRADRSAYRVHTPLTLSLRKLRLDQARSRAEFAAMYGLDESRLQSWEEGRVDLDSAEQSLVKLILDDPERASAVLSRPFEAAE